MAALMPGREWGLFSQAALAHRRFLRDPRPAFKIIRDELRNSLGPPGIALLDVREPREYAGETPYGESRGGHVPGAKHLFYKALLESDGKVLPGDLSDWHSTSAERSSK